MDKFTKNYSVMWIYLMIDCLPKISIQFVGGIVTNGKDLLKMENIKCFLFPKIPTIEAFIPYKAFFYTWCRKWRVGG